MFISTAWAQDAAAGAAGMGGNALVSQLFGFLPIVLIFVIFYFLLIKPQNEEAKKHAAMIKALKKGDAVETQGGIWGVLISVPAVDEKDAAAPVRLQVADGVEITLNRGAIGRLLSEDEAKGFKKGLDAAGTSGKKR